MSGYCPDCGNTQCLCNEIAAYEAKVESSFARPTLLGCPNCKSTNIIKLWRAEIVVWPGGNSDDTTKGYRYGCHDCESIFYAR